MILLVLLSCLVSAVRCQCFYNEQFTTNDGGYSVATSPAGHEGPWIYTPGSWGANGQDSEVGVATSTVLTSPPIALAESGPFQLSFVHRYGFEVNEAYWDGGQVRVSINGGAPITLTGADWTSNGYTGVVEISSPGSTIGGQSAFVDSTPDFAFITSIALLPGAVSGDSIQLIFAFEGDSNTRGPGVPNWQIDAVTVCAVGPLATEGPHCWIMDAIEESSKSCDWITHSDGYLVPFDDEIRRRHGLYLSVKDRISNAEGSLAQFASSYNRFGIHKTKHGICVREWLPGAKEVYVFGDFNHWRRHEWPAQRNQFGVWEVTIPAQASLSIVHGQFIKLGVVTEKGEFLERIPAWIRRVDRRPPNVHFDGVFWDPPVAKRHVWKHPRPAPHDRGNETLRIYECHVGMCSEEPKVASYEEFRVNVLPRVHALGYNALQIMAIMEHPYYGSFGYQVTSLFAASSRFGTPEDLQHLIDDAHGLGMRVLLDVVHSHASSNSLDGLNEYDGTDHCYFHAGERGKHPQWDSRLFNYGHWEVLRFLLSNVSYWVNEFRFDGYRYDGVTSMLYLHHGIGNSFAGGYADYFSPSQADVDAIVYLCLANDLCHQLGALTIAEDVSGYPGIARPLREGGMGFDYRLHMAVADKWIELLKHEKDEDWSMGALVHTCTNRRYQEGHIVYSESHDQSLVGDKTIMMWLAGSEIYTHMSTMSPPSFAIDRAIALHKMILSISWALGGEGLLNFCGNEFGHPEWVDFPREGNNDSYHYARRQWSLAKDPLLKYHFLQEWNQELLKVEQQYHYCGWGREYTVVTDENAKVIASERPVGKLLWIWNFHATRSHEGFHIAAHSRGAGWRVLCSSDEKRFGGHDRVGKDLQYQECPTIYLPSRTCIVLYRVEEGEKK